MKKKLLFMNLKEQKECEKLKNLNFVKLTKLLLNKQEDLKIKYQNRINKQNELVSNLFQILKTQKNAKSHFLKSQKQELKDYNQISLYEEENEKVRIAAQQLENNLTYALQTQMREEIQKQEKIMEARKSPLAAVLNYKYDI